MVYCSESDLTFRIPAWTFPYLSLFQTTTIFGMAIGIPNEVFETNDIIVIENLVLVESGR